MTEPKPKTLELSFNYSADLAFRWQMFFNRFTVERVESGRIVSFAFAYEGRASEIVPVMISDEGLIQLRHSAEKYLSNFAGAASAPSETEKLPAEARRFSPLFSNHVRLSRSGKNAEVIFYTVPLSFIADEIAGRRKPKSDMSLIPVAILHSSDSVHYRLLNRLLDDIPDKFDEETPS